MSRVDELLHLTTENFESEVLESETPVLVGFSAVWCAPCRALEPTIKELAAESEGAYKVGKVDIDQSAEIAKKYAIRSVPSVLVFWQGKVVETMIGIQSKDRYREVVLAASESA